MTSNTITPVVFVNGRIVLSESILDSGVLIADQGLIKYVGPTLDRLPPDASVIDAAGCWIVPGFVDIHVHGGGGADFMDGTVSSVLTALHAHACHGTTTLFPTTTTGTPPQIDSMLSAVSDARMSLSSMLGNRIVGSRIAGVHLYGPFFAKDKVGCHRQDGRRDPTPAEYDRYFESKLIRIATCAAELEGAAHFYRSARQHGCLVTCGHSNATWSEMQIAFEAGMRHVDHFWCAMSSVSSLRSRCGTPMQASMEQYVLAKESMSTEVIADGYHLSDELLSFAFKMKGSKRLCLVSDSSRALDMPNGCYRFGNEYDGEWFVYDGKVGRTLDGDGLASSASSLDHMIRIMLRATNAPFHEIIRMASLTPAELTGIADFCGSLDAGKQADLVLLDSKLEPRRVFIGGLEMEP